METVFEFTLPKGYLDSTGQLHRKGKMRLATAGDEISATRDPRVLSNPSYLTIVILGKVVTELEGLQMVTANVIEKLFTADWHFYRICISESMILSRRSWKWYARTAERFLRPP